MKNSIVILGIALLAGSAVADVNQAQPKSYVELASVGFALGYHGWTPDVFGQPIRWLGLEGSAVEGSYFVTPRLGLGLVVADATVNLDSSYRTSGLRSPWFNTYFILAPVILYVTNSSARSFGYASLKLMPYTPSSSMNGAALGLDWAYVPFAPWPLEARAGLEATLDSWTGTGRQVGYHVSVGVRASLGWWFMRR